MIWDKAWVFPFLGNVETLTTDTLLWRQAKLREAMEKANVDAALISLDAYKGGARWFFNDIAIGANDDGFALLPPKGRTIEGGEASQVTPMVRNCGDALHLSLGEAAQFAYASALEGVKRIGWTHPEQLPVAVARQIEQQLPQVEWVDITQLYTQTRALRCEADLLHMNRSAVQHDRLMAVAQTAIRFGRNEQEIVNDLKIDAYRNGGAGFSTFYFAGAALVSAQPGERTSHNGVAYPGRTICPGDQVAVRMQAIGLGGYYGDIARLFCCGVPTEETKRYWATVRNVQALLADKARPGATVAQLWPVYQEALEKAGMARYRADFINGVGYCPAEGPSGAYANVELGEDMTISIHPTVFDDAGFPYCCADLFRITPDGAMRMTQATQEIITL